MGRPVPPSESSHFQQGRESSLPPSLLSPALLLPASAGLFFQFFPSLFPPLSPSPLFHLCLLESQGTDFPPPVKPGILAAMALPCWPNWSVRLRPAEAAEAKQRWGPVTLSPWPQRSFLYGSLGVCHHSPCHHSPWPRENEQALPTLGSGFSTGEVRGLVRGHTAGQRQRQDGGPATPSLHFQGTFGLVTYLSDVFAQSSVLTGPPN